MSSRVRKLALAAGLVALLGVAAAVAAWQWPRHVPPPAAPPDDNPDPRLTYATPYRNVRPEVRYVGDAACDHCHVEQAETFHRHPMGRSLLPVSRTAARREEDRLAHNPFTQFGDEFRVERQGEHVFHAEARRDAGGRVVAEAREEVLYDVGCGTHGHSYLVERDGCLYQSPVSRFTQTQRWDLSPGFGPHFHFNRPIGVDCLFCHCNYADHVEDTLNRYRAPAFHGDAIGCERCHGPGELHVRARERGDAVAGQVDDTIVNPKHLGPGLREAVCQQCHLEGEERVLRRGRQPFDFRPGLPLQLFWTVFVKRPGLPESMKAVSHVEQLAVSRCFTGSRGKLGCSSCHDPHVEPAPAARVAYYRDRCARCHAEGSNGCTVALAERRRRNGDDCTACHLPRSGNRDVAHTAASDHRILRRPDAEGPAARPPARPRPGEWPFVAFHHDLPGVGERELNRDRGLALVAMARKMPRSAAPVAVGYALPLLEDALAAWPGDVPCREGQVYALLVQDRPEEALEAGEAALALAPGREQVLIDLVQVCQALGRPREGLDYCRRALAVAPSSAPYRLNEARLLGQLEDWSGAVASARRAVQVDPFAVDAHLVLADGCLHTGRKEEARAELDVLAALDPSRAEQFRRWFAEQLR